MVNFTEKQPTHFFIYMEYSKEPAVVKSGCMSRVDLGDTTRVFILFMQREAPVR